MIEWDIDDVMQWATTVLQNAKLPQEAINSTVDILMGEYVTGTALLLYEDRTDLKTSLGLPDGSARPLWAEIEKLKSLTEPGKRRPFAQRKPIIQENEYFHYKTNVLHVTDRKRKRGDDSTDRVPRKKIKSELEHIISNTTVWFKNPINVAHTDHVLLAESTPAKH